MEGARGDEEALSQSTSIARPATSPPADGEALLLRDPLEPVPLRASQPGAAQAARHSQRVRRSHVLAAVRRLIAEVGCENVTVRGIAETSGYAVQTVYNLVGPRDEAISAAISEYSIFVGRTASPNDADPCAIPAIAERWMEAIALNPEFVRQSNILFFTASRPIYYRFRDRQIRGLYNLLRRQKACGIIREEVDLHMLAERLGLFASAMCVDWADRPFPLAVLREKLCGGLADMLLESLAPAHREPLLAWIARMRGT
jgi:AcrR family transcriptional regulator